MFFSSIVRLILKRTLSRDPSFFYFRPNSDHGIIMSEQLNLHLSEPEEEMIPMAARGEDLDPLDTTDWTGHGHGLDWKRTRTGHGNVTIRKGVGMHGTPAKARTGWLACVRFAHAGL